MSQNQIKELITAKELAKELNLSVETIWRYTREKRIPYVELGPKQYRYKFDDVVNALNSSLVKEKSDKYEISPDQVFTYEDYLKLPEEPGYRFEILEGMLIKEPSPNVLHQRVSRRLQRILEDYFWEQDADGEIFNAPLDVTFQDNTVVQPDLFYVSGEQKLIIKDTRIDGSPTLVVEIISPFSRRKDRLQKLRIYQKNKIPHYWIVNPEDKTLECFSIQNGIYALVATGMDNDTVEHPDFPGLSVQLKSLW